MIGSRIVAGVAVRHDCSSRDLIIQNGIAGRNVKPSVGAR